MAKKENKVPLKERPGFQKFKNVFPSIASGLLNVVGTVIPGVSVAADIIDGLVNQGEVSAAEGSAAKQYLLEHEKDIFALEVADRQSAREREIALKDTFGVYIQNISAIVVIAGFLGLLFTVVFMTASIANAAMVNIMIGSLGTIVVQIFAYWYGSSQGSKQKSGIIDRVVNGFK